MAIIKSSGSSGVIVTSGVGPDVFGPWVPLFMGFDQATHGLNFDSTWAMIEMADPVPASGVPPLPNIGRRHDVEIGRGPTAPPAEIVWGPMRFATISAGGGRGNECNYSFPLELLAGDQLWVRQKSTDVGVTADLVIFVTTWDGVKPARAATAHFSTADFFTTGFIGPVGAGSPDAPEGGSVLFPASNILGLWHIITPPAGLAFNASWLSVTTNLTSVGTNRARWQLASTPPGGPGPPPLPELIDVGFQSLGGSGSHVQVLGDVKNFPIPYETGEGVWIRGASIVSFGLSRSLKVAMTFWGNP